MFENLDNNTILGLAFGLGCGMLLGWLARSKLRPRTALMLAENGLGGSVDSVGEGGDYKLVLVVRTDLKMGKGKMAAQCCHASVMAFEQLGRTSPALLKEWRYNGQPKVVVKTEDEESLMKLAAHARKVGLTISLVQDAGRTQIAPGSKTVLGVGPGPVEKVDIVTGHLKLC